MNALQNDAQMDTLSGDTRYERVAQARLTPRSLHPLSPQEISEVAGGPEVDVGNGISPP